MPEINRGENLEQSTITPETEHLIKEKLWSAWGSARDQFKVPNLHRTAEIFYQALYEPEKINAEEIVDNPVFKRVEYLTEPISTKIKPEKQEFILAIRRAMTKEVDFERCLYPNAKEILKIISEVGPVTLWTRGDVDGIEDTEYQGSHEQVKKVAFSGLNDLRKDIAEERGIENYHDVFSIEASEDKFKHLADIVKKYEQQKIEKIVILEDLTKNIVKAKEMISKETQIPVEAIWVRQGLGKDSIPKDEGLDSTAWQKQLHAVESLEQVPEQLEAQGFLKEHTGFIVDFDNVLSNDEIRKEVQFEAVLNKLQNKGWV